MSRSPAQIAAITASGHDCLVTAGAGTGKTTVLVERVLYKLQSGVPLDELLVVTFTEKAAREMKERIYQTLSQAPALRRNLSLLPRAAISTIHGFCARLLREHFLEAQVEPAFRVLDEAGQAEALAEALRRTFHQWYLLGASGQGREFQSLLEMAGFDSRGEVLREVVLSLYKYARVTPDPEAYLGNLLVRPAATRLAELPWHDAMVEELCGDGAGREGAWTHGVQVYGRALDLLRAGGKNPGRMGRLHELLAATPVAEMSDPRAQRALVDILRREGLAEEDREFRICFPRAPSGGRQLPGFERLHKAAKDLLAAAAVRRLPWNEDLLLREDGEQKQALHVLVDLVREMDAHYRQYKDRNGLLDFSDLEIGASRLLRERGVDLGLDRRFREVLVDEFQDVNALQNEILSRLSPPEERFRVGDVKQSIYQFRLAEPAIFLSLTSGRTPVRRPEDIRGNDPLLIFLAENHRSRPAVLAFANHLFRRIFDRSVIGSSYEDQALVAGRAPGAPESPVELHLIDARERAEDQEREGANGNAQAHLAARRLRRLILEERPPIPDREGVEHPPRWKDAAVLLRSLTHAEEFQAALAAEGIPAYLAQGGSLLEERAVADLRCLLSVIDNPRDDVALAAVLRSPLYGFADSELLRLRLSWPEGEDLLDAVAAGAYGEELEEGAFWPPPPEETGCGAPRRNSRPGADPQAARVSGLARRARWTGHAASDARELVGPQLRGRLRRALEQIRLWRREQGEMELVRFLLHVLEESGFRAALLGRPGHARAEASVEKLLALARGYELERGHSLHGFLARLASLEADGIDGVPRSAEDEDAVAILSIHGAKGLEFPIVIVPQLEWSPPRADLGEKIRIGRKWVGLRHLDFEMWERRDRAARRVLAAMQQEDSRREEARILYVALTRARERLVLIGSVRSLPWEEGLPEDPEHRAWIAEERLKGGRSALDWILATLVWDEAERDQAASLRFRFRQPPLLVERHPLSELAQAAPAPAGEGERRETLRRALRGRLPLTGENGGTSEELDRVLERLGRESPFPLLARLDDLKGKYWVTEFKSLADRERFQELEEEGARLGLPGGSSGRRARAGVGASLGAEQSAHLGILYHAALSRCDLTKVDEAGWEAQFAGFARAPWWDGPRDPATEAGIIRFFASPLGARLVRAAAADPMSVEREATFSLKWPVPRLMPWTPRLRSAVEEDPRWRRPDWARALAEAWVLIQGRIDCLFATEEGWIILDWKTDRLAGEEEVAARAREYSVQMEIYREAVARLWGPVAGVWLVFVNAGIVQRFPGD